VSVSTMSSYEKKVWDSLTEHWDAKANRRTLPSWATKALDTAGEVAGTAAGRVGDATPELLKSSLQKAGDSISAAALRPAVEGAAIKRGAQIDSFVDLREQDLKFCDRLLTRHTLGWATVGALEGGAMGALALVPIAGIPLAITADVLVVQALSVSIAARIS